VVKLADRIKGITVEIGGDTTGLSKALSGVNKNIGDTQKQLKDVERLLKLDPGNTELLRQKYELLNQEVEQTDVKLKALKDAEKQVQAQFQRGDIGKDKYDALKREVIETEAKLGNLRSEAAKAKNTVNGIDENPIEEVARAADDAEESLQDAGKEASNFGDYLKAGAIVEGAKGIASSLKDAAESSKEYMKIMGSLEISSQKAGYSAEETAAAYNTLYGVLGDNQTAATTTANLQALGLAQRQLEQLINGTIGAWATYGDSIPIDGLAEAINETVQTGKVTGTFADVLNWAGTSEDEFNKKLEEANSAAERANLVLNELSRQGLMNAGKAWQDNNEVLVESNKANAEYEDSMAQLSETVLPIITKITEAVTKFINFILDNRASVVAALTAIAAGFAAFKITSLISSLISGFTTFFGVIKSGQGVMAALNAVMSANPIGLIITAVAALVAAFIYLWNNCEEFRQFWIDLWENIKKVFSDVWNAIVGFFTETIPNAIGKVTEIFQKFDNWLTGIFSADWSESFGAFGEIINGFFANVKNIWNSIKKVFQGIIDFVSGVFSGDWSKAWEGIKSIFSGIWDGFVSIVKMPINGIIGLINAMIDGINWVIEKINTISFDVPDWIPFVGGQTWGFNLPTIGKIPYLAKGGILSQGSAVVGEAGPELLTMAGGRAVVQPLTNQNTNTTNFGGVNFYVYGAPGQDINELTDQIMDRMETVYRIKGAVWG
jgi:phage-related minor tail protein